VTSTSSEADRVAQLRTTPLFAEVPEEHLLKLAAVAVPLHLAPGEVLLREGDAAEELFVVVRGELEITKHSGNAEIPLTRVGPGSIQGEMAAFERGQRNRGDAFEAERRGEGEEIVAHALEHAAHQSGLVGRGDPSKAEIDLVVGAVFVIVPRHWCRG